MSINTTADTKPLLTEEVATSNVESANASVPMPDGYVEDESGKMKTLEVCFIDCTYL